MYKTDEVEKKCVVGTSGSVFLACATGPIIKDRCKNVFLDGKIIKRIN